MKIAAMNVRRRIQSEWGVTASHRHMDHHIVNDGGGTSIEPHSCGEGRAGKLAQSSIYHGQRSGHEPAAR
jgi:hypothetical protein